MHLALRQISTRILQNRGEVKAHALFGALMVICHISTRDHLAGVIRCPFGHTERHAAEHGNLILIWLEIVVRVPLLVHSAALTARRNLVSRPTLAQTASGAGNIAGPERHYSTLPRASDLPQLSRPPNKQAPREQSRASLLPSTLHPQAQNLIISGSMMPLSRSLRDVQARIRSRDQQGFWQRRGTSLSYDSLFDAAHASL